VIQGNIIRLIVVEESANDAELILNALRKARFPIRPRHVEDAEDFQKALSEQEWDLVISVPFVGDFTVKEIAELIKNSKQDIPLIVLTRKFAAESLVELLSNGARQVLPSENDTCLQIAVRKELEDLESRQSLRRVEQLYRQSQQHNKILLETSRDAISYVHDGMHIHANPAYLEMFGYQSLDELEGMPVMDLVAAENHTKFKEFMREYMTDENQQDRDIELIGVRNAKGKKAKFKLKMEVSQALYDNERCIQIIIRDQSDNSKELEKKLKEMSKLDQVTGLYNSQYFLQLLEKALSKVIESHTRSLVLYLQLDNFSKVREQIGIAGCDPILANIAKSLKTVVEETAIARFGEYAFTLLLHDSDTNSAQDFAEKLRRTVENCVTEVDEKSIVVTCSVGIAQVLASAGTPQSVLSDAHNACKSAVQQGGNRVEIYKAIVRTGGGEDALKDVTKLIETAEEEKRLSLVYQPIVSLRGEVEEIYEVFLRMVDTAGTNVPAGTLFSAAEKANLSIKLDKWVLKEAAQICLKRQKSGHKTNFFIKLSDQVVKDETIVLYINKLLRASHLSGEHFTIEISEATAISQVKYAKAFVMQLKKMGCRTALEHFGTSLNSETILKHLPVDFVKIDSSYAKGLSSNAEHQNAVKKIVEMVHSYEKKTIAEAVEDANSLTVLWQCEVDFAQGHYIQEPLDTLDYDFTEE
jgi:multidomain signaling protein FimX